jgi:hypothetical protein
MMGSNGWPAAKVRAVFSTQMKYSMNVADVIEAGPGIKSQDFYSNKKPVHFEPALL